MINLIDIKDISSRKDGEGNILGLALDNWLNQIVRQKLALGMKLNELIYTNDLRGIGKTHELIEFAKKYELVVVIYSSNLAKQFRETYNYRSIYGCTDNVLRGMKRVVVDECVDVEKLSKDMNCNVVTGFINGSTKYKNKNISFNDEVINTLKDEMNLLINKMKSTLNNNDYGTYKNLVLAFKEVSRLVIDLQENPIK